jgi:hypothetical protein
MKNPFVPILEPYYDWLTDIFGSLSKQVVDHKITSGQLARDFLSEPIRRSNFQAQLPSLNERISNFWRDNGKRIDAEIIKLPGLKARFGGDIGPQVTDSIFERAGIYYESIIVPDPLIRVIKLPQDLTKIKDYYFLKYAINQVLMKDIFLADIYPPIAILCDDIEFEQSIKAPIVPLANIDCIAFTNELYGTKFDTYKDVESFYSKFDSLHQAVKSAEKPELLYWDELAPRDPLQQLDAYLENTSKEMDLNFLSEKFPKAELLIFSIRGRMLQANSVLFAAYNYKAHPLLAAPVSFHWLSWVIQANRNLIIEEVGYQNNLELSTTNALLSKNLEWLSNIPISSLIELRRKGYLSDLRDIIGNEIEKLATSDPRNLEIVVSQVDYNISSALERHQEQIKNLDDGFRKELGVLGSTFLLGVTAAIQPSLVPSAPEWAIGLGSIVGTTSFATIVSEVRKYIRERKDLSKTPVGILWSAKQKFGKE